MPTDFGINGYHHWHGTLNTMMMFMFSKSIILCSQCHSYYYSYQWRNGVSATICNWGLRPRLVAALEIFGQVWQIFGEILIFKLTRLGLWVQPEVDRVLIKSDLSGILKDIWYTNNQFSCVFLFSHSGKVKTHFIIFIAIADKITYRWMQISIRD